MFVLEPGTYRFMDEEHECDCAEQKALYKHYLLAGIGTQYMKLDWERDFRGSARVKQSVIDYLDDWKWCRKNGHGMEFASTKQGTGKTFAATWIGKQLIKRGEKVLFFEFRELIGLYENPDRDELDKQLRTTTVLILDEVVPPATEAQKALFADKFERLIRHRTNFDLPTIMTTNLTPEKLREAYKRTYSLLEAKQMRVIMDGEDARQSWVQTEQLELRVNEETRPIV